MLELVGGGVDLGDDDVLVLLEVLSQLVVDGRQLLAVTAPVKTIFYKYLYLYIM